MGNYFDDYDVDGEMGDLTVPDVIEDTLADAALLPDLAAPGSSPTPTCQGMLGGIFVKWTPITNSSPVTYDVHVSTTSGFTADTAELGTSTTKVGQDVQGSMFVIRKLADGSALAYDTDYYVVLIASDVDGDAPQSTQATGRMDQTASGDIVAGAITAEKLAAVLTISSLFQTASSGQRVEIDTDGIRLIASDGSIIVNVPTDSATNASFNGDIEIGTEVVHTLQTMEGTLELDQGSYLVANSYQADPSTAPTVTQATKTFTFNSSSTEAAADRHGLWFDGTYFIYLVGAAFDDQVLVRVNATTGAEVDRTTIRSGSAGDTLISIVKIGSYWYGLGYDSLYSFYHYIWADAAGLPSGTSPTKRAFSDWTGWYAPMSTTDGTDLYICQSDTTPVGGTTKAQILRYTVSGTSAPSLASTRLTSNTGPGNGSIAGYYRGNGDFGAARNVILTDSSATIRVYDTANPSAAQTTSNWTGVNPSANYGPGIAYDGTYFYQLSNSAKELTKYNVTWSADDGTNSVSYFYAYTWNDSAGTTHESGLSPRTQLNRKSRRWVTVTWPTIPGAGGADEPNSVNIYAKQTSSATSADTFAELFEQSMAQTGTSKELSTYTAVTAGSQDTSFSAVGTAAILKSAGATAGVQGTSAQSGWKLGADGAGFGFAPDVQVFTAGTGGSAGTVGNAADLSAAQATATWYKPLTGPYTEVEVILIGGGGGGGGGRRDSTAGPSRGGGGGAGGGYQRIVMPIGAFSATETVKTGKGGGGGGGRTGNNDGFAGGDGGDSSMTVAAGAVVTLTARGGAGGAGGASGSGGGGGAGGNILGGGDGGAGGRGGDCGASSAGAGDTTPSMPTGTAVRMGAPGGGAGGGYNAGAFVGADGGARGADAGGAGAGTGGSNGTGGVNNGSETAGAQRTGIGSGGGGGGGRNNATAGDGGAGGLFGAGGGGGGGAANGASATSGSGGRGRNGIVIVITR